MAFGLLNTLGILTPAGFQLQLPSTTVVHNSWSPSLFLAVVRIAHNGKMQNAGCTWLRGKTKDGRQASTAHTGTGSKIKHHTEATIGWARATATATNQQPSKHRRQDGMHTDTQAGRGFSPPIPDWKSAVKMPIFSFCSLRTAETGVPIFIFIIDDHEIDKNVSA